jgi:deazaflavin-dependent oxidoreductase (nitroreductase family)
MGFRRRLARFNVHVTNPIQRNWAWRLAPWVVIVHRGRRSGKTYLTPTFGSVRGDRVVIPVLYGEQSDWLRNVLAAGGGALTRSGKTRTLTAPRLETRGRTRVLVGDLGEEIARGDPRGMSRG